MKTAYEVISSLSIIDQQGIKLSFILSVTETFVFQGTSSIDTLRRRSAISIDLECMMKVNKPQLFNHTTEVFVADARGSVVRLNLSV